MKRHLTKIIFLLGILGLLWPQVTWAMSDAQRALFDEGIYYFNPDASAAACSDTIQADAGTNQDYAGRTILSQGLLSSLAANTPTYQQAATQVGIPWQVLAALHYRETGFSLSDPSNGQGLYQIVDASKHTPGAYPDGQVTQAQFLAQTLDAANFIKVDGAGLTDQPSIATVKDALVKYNGEPTQYVTQAEALGYTSDQGYEGSPYVMNIADKPRDPTNGPLAYWLQDRGGGNFVPATADQYGAFVVFASVSGLSIGGSCSSQCNGNPPAGLSVVRQDVLCIAQQELSKWDNNELKPGTGYLQYTENNQWDWCADFVSWVYDQAKYPLRPDPGWRVDSVDDIKGIGQQNDNFHWHDRAGYTPKPGDIAIHNDGSKDYHANIVVGVSGNTVTLIGGNQASDDYNLSRVSKDTLNNDIVGFVTPD